MKKFTASIVAAVIAGVLTFLITERFGLGDPAPDPKEELHALLEAPRAPLIEWETPVLDQNTIQFTLAPGETQAFKVADLWKGPALSDPGCADAGLVFTWRVRDPHPGGRDLEFRRPVPQTEMSEQFASGSSGQATAGWCTEFEASNRELVPLTVEIRHGSVFW